MKGNELLKHLGGFPKRGGSAHSLWINPNTGKIEAVPRHTEMSDRAAIKICRALSIPDLK